MLSQLQAFLTAPFWATYVFPIALAFLLAYLLQRGSGSIGRRLLRLNRFASGERRMQPERATTLTGLLASFVSFFGFVVALLFALSLFVAPDTLVWFVGLFSAAFGLGARPLVNDYLAGMSFIFGDTFNVGDKVEILAVEGIIERVDIRETAMRAPSGELYTIPNGEIRVVRNFSRGLFSKADITIKVKSSELPRALAWAEPLGAEAVVLLPNLLEPWSVINKSGTIGSTAELTLITKTRYGKGAEMRPRLLALVQNSAQEAGIELLD